MILIPPTILAGCDYVTVDGPDVIVHGISGRIAHVATHQRREREFVRQNVAF